MEPERSALRRCLWQMLQEPSCLVANAVEDCQTEYIWTFKFRFRMWGLGFGVLEFQVGFTFLVSDNLTDIFTQTCLIRFWD